MENHISAVNRAKAAVVRRFFPLPTRTPEQASRDRPDLTPRSGSLGRWAPRFVHGGLQQASARSARGEYAGPLTTPYSSQLRGSGEWGRLPHGCCLAASCTAAFSSSSTCDMQRSAVQRSAGQRARTRTRTASPPGPSLLTRWERRSTGVGFAGWLSGGLCSYSTR